MRVSIKRPETLALATKIIKTNIGIVHSEGVQEIQYRFCHHRRTAALALRLSTIRDHVAHMNFRLTLRFPHKLKFAGTPLKGYLCALSHEKPIHGLLHSNVNNSSHPKHTGTSRVNKNRGTHGSPSILI